MPSPFDSVHTARQRPAPRASPRLEVLEARCLLSGPEMVAAAPASVPAFVQGPAGPIVARYLIVRETDDPHYTLDTAQVLPDVPFFGVIGNLDPGARVELFRMNVSPGTVSLQFDLESLQTSPATPIQLWLFDGTGRVVSKWSSGDGPGATSVGLEVTGSLPGSTLYLGISTGDPSGSVGESPGIAYQLWVTRFSVSDSKPTIPGSGFPAPTSDLPVFAAPFQSPSAPIDSTPLGGSAAAPSFARVPTGSGTGLRLAVGSPITRSAGPSGGVMSGSDPSSAASHVTAAIHLEWVDRSLQTAGPRPEGEAGPLEVSGGGNGGKALVAVFGPGGFPLLGAAAVGNWRRAPASASTFPADPSNPEGAVPLPTESLSVQSLPSGADTPPNGADHPLVAVASGRTLGNPGISLFSGLGLATVLTLNAVLSDPIAGFDYLACLLDPLSRDSRRARKDRDRKRSE